MWPLSQVAHSLFIASGFLFFRQLVVPNIFAQTKFARKRFGFTNTDFAPFVQVFLNKGVIGVFLGNIFHDA